MSPCAATGGDPTGGPSGSGGVSRQRDASGSGPRAGAGAMNRPMGAQPGAGGVAGAGGWALRACRLLAPCCCALLAPSTCTAAACLGVQEPSLESAARRRTPVAC